RQSQMHRGDRGLPPVRRLQHERNGLQGGRSRLPAAVPASQEHRGKSLASFRAPPDDPHDTETPMKLLLCAVLLSALVMVCRGSAARAMDANEMESQRMISFGIGGGVAVPVADAKDAFKTGFNGQGFVRFNLHGLPVQPRLEFSLSHFDVDEVKVGTTGTG